MILSWIDLKLTNEVLAQVQLMLDANGFPLVKSQEERLDTHDIAGKDLENDSECELGSDIDEKPDDVVRLKLID